MNKDVIDDRYGRFREIPFALANKGHKVCGLCLSYSHREEGWFLDGPMRWKSINASPLKVTGLAQYILTSMQLARKCDIIWACSDSLYGIIGCMLGKLYSKPVVFDIYDNFDEFFLAKLPLIKQLYHWAIRKSDSITCLSKPFAKMIFKNFHRQNGIHPIGFAVPKNLFRPLDKKNCRQELNLPADALLVGTAGGLSRIREVHLLIGAFLKLKNTIPEMQLILAGHLDPKLRIPNDPRIRYLGILPYRKIPVLMNSLDVAVVCYADDDYGKYCFPQKTREFMACGLPLIAASVGSLKELLQDQPQWLYKPGSIESLAKVLKNRISDRSTDYPKIPTWADLAESVEQIMIDTMKRYR